MEIRSLTEHGLAEFERIVRDSPEAAGDMDARAELLGLSAPIRNAGEVGIRPFANKLEFAQFVSDQLSAVDRELLSRDRGLWSWIALYYFDQLTERDADGVIVVKDVARYVLSADRRREYRHLVKGPVDAYRLHQQRARLLLTNPLHRWSDVEEQITAVQEIVRMPGAMEAADILYFDARKNVQKRGITNRKKPGNIRRFATVVQQLDLTYDLYSMTGVELLSLMPSEFDRFRAS